MEELFIRVLNISMTASWIVIAVILLRLVLKKAPRWIQCLWWSIVGIRLVLPFSFESIVSIIPQKTFVSSDIMYSQSPTVSTGIPALNTVINPVISATFAPTPENSVNPMQIITTISAYLWAVGLAVMLVYALVSFLALRRKLRTAVKDEGNIFFSEFVKSPFILGIIKPKIYLPFGLEDNEKAYIVAHEKAHLKRFDHLIKPLSFLLLSVYWFNPVLWIAYILLCRDIEIAADERATKNYDKENRQKYSLALLENSTRRKIIAACPLAFGEVGVKKRVKSVMNYKKPAFWVIIIAIVSVIVASIVLLTDPITDGEKEFTPFGKSYSVAKVIYTSSFNNGPFTADATPHFTITAERELYECDNWSEDWLCSFGTFEETEISEENFDSCFKYYGVDAHWLEDIKDEKELRKKAEKAWILTDEYSKNIYYLIYCSDGTLYLSIENDYEDEINLVYELEAKTALSGPIFEWEFNPMLSLTGYYILTFSVETKEEITVTATEGTIEKIKTDRDDLKTFQWIPEQKGYKFTDAADIFINPSEDNPDSAEAIIHIAESGKPKTESGGTIYVVDVRSDYYYFDMDTNGYINVLKSLDVYTFDRGYDKAMLTLHPNNESFVFTFSYFADVIYYGKYSSSENSIFLTDENNSDNVFCFRIENGNLIFDRDKTTAPIPEYNYGKVVGTKTPLPDKAEFVRVNLNREQ